VSKITCSKMIAAAVTAADLRATAFDDGTKTGREVASRCSYIIGTMQSGPINAVSIKLIKRYISEMLSLRMDTYWRNAWTRRHCGEIEEALGLEHDIETLKALDAARSNADDAWRSFCEGFRARGAPTALSQSEAAAS
jgi:hypothetical protein